MVKAPPAWPGHAHSSLVSAAPGAWHACLSEPQIPNTSKSLAIKLQSGSMHTKFHLRGRLKTVPPFVPNLLPPYSTAFRGTSPFSATPKKMNPYSPNAFDWLYRVVPTAEMLTKTVQANKSIDRFPNSITVSSSQLLDVFAIGE